MLLTLSRQKLFSFLLLSTLIICCTMASEDNKRDRKLVGGWTEQDVNSQSIQEWADKAVTKFNQQNNDANQHIVTKIVSARSQVVAGAKYQIRVEFGRTNCKKGEVCGKNEPVESKSTYDIEIFHQPWTKTEEITFVQV